MEKVYELSPTDVKVDEPVSNERWLFALGIEGPELNAVTHPEGGVYFSDAAFLERQTDPDSFHHTNTAEKLRSFILKAAVHYRRKVLSKAIVEREMDTIVHEKVEAVCETSDVRNALISNEARILFALDKDPHDATEEITAAAKTLKTNRRATIKWLSNFYTSSDHLLSLMEMKNEELASLSGSLLLVYKNKFDQSRPGRGYGLNGSPIALERQWKRLTGLGDQDIIDSEEFADHASMVGKACKKLNDAISGQHPDVLKGIFKDSYRINSEHSFSHGEELIQAYLPEVNKYISDTESFLDPEFISANLLIKIFDEDDIKRLSPEEVRKVFARTVDIFHIVQRRETDLDSQMTRLILRGSGLKFSEIARRLGIRQMVSVQNTVARFADIIKKSNVSLAQLLERIELSEAILHAKSLPQESYNLDGAMPTIDPITKRARTYLHRVFDPVDLGNYLDDLDKESVSQLLDLVFGAIGKLIERRSPLIRVTRTWCNTGEGEIPEVPETLMDPRRLAPLLGFVLSREIELAVSQLAPEEQKQPAKRKSRPRKPISLIKKVKRPRSASKRSPVDPPQKRRLLNHELLTAEQEVELAKDIEAGIFAREILDTLSAPSNDQKVQAGSGEASVKELKRLIQLGLRAREEFILKNQKLVASVARLPKYDRYVSNGWVTHEDLLQMGNMGLARAIDKFDFDKGYKFSTYAYGWVGQFIQRELDDTARAIRVPVHAQDEIRAIKSERTRFVQRWGREPTWQELAEKVNMSEEVLREKMEHDRNIISLDKPVGEDGDATLGDFVADSTQVMGAYEDIITKGQLKSLLSLIKPRDAEILILRFVKQLTNEEIGERVGLNRHSVSYRISRSLELIRNHPDFEDMQAS